MIGGTSEETAGHEEEQKNVSIDADDAEAHASDDDGESKRTPQVNILAGTSEQQQADFVDTELPFDPEAGREEDDQGGKRQAGNFGGADADVSEEPDEQPPEPKAAPHEPKETQPEPKEDLEMHSDMPFEVDNVLKTQVLHPLFPMTHNTSETSTVIISDGFETRFCFFLKRNSPVNNGAL